jgi:CubicO group peptidase (beta-lactamase class C family)
MKFCFQFLMLTMILTIHCSVYAQVESKKLDKFFIKKMKKAQIAGMQVAYIKDGELGWVGSYGMKNDSTKEKINDSTLFMIASCAKPVTALGLMKLYDANIISLDDNINKYLPTKIVNPNFPEKVITIKMILTHTSSFSDNGELLNSLYTYQYGGDSPISLEQFIKDYFLLGGKYYDPKKNFSANTPGTTKSYCNAGYALAGYLIECITRKAFKDYMAEEIFKPLHMNNSYWFLSEIAHDNVSLPHAYVGDAANGKQFRILKHYGYPTVSDGQLRTHTSDYAQIIKLMLNDGRIGQTQFLKKENIQAFLTIQFPEANKYQAISWNYNEFDNWIYYLLMPRLPSHTGVDQGVATVTSFDPKRKTGAIIFANTLTHNFKGNKIFYQEMIKKLMKEARKTNKI